MYLILTQKPETESTYEDKLWERYHFPRQYASLVKPGQLFIYYKSQQNAPRNSKERYYFGAGVIGAVWADPHKPGHYFAELLDAIPFVKRVPLRQPNDDYYESINRRSSQPPWQSAVRSLTKEAYEAILLAGGLATEAAEQVSAAKIEGAGLSLMDLLDRLNSEYIDTVPEKRSSVTERYLDRGSSVTKALKAILGDQCQICGVRGFIKKDGTRYVEAHHLDQVAGGSKGALCSDNIILVCPTCHRRLHYAEVRVGQPDDLHMSIEFEGETPVLVLRNTKEHLAFLQSKARQ